MMPQLDPSHFLSQIFWLVITFTVLFAYLKCFILPKVQGIIDDRAFSSKDDRTKAAALQEEISRLHEEITKRHRMNAEAIEQLHKETETEIRLAREGHLRKLNADFLHKQEQLLKEISEAKASAIAKMKDYVVDYAALVLSKLTIAKPDTKLLGKYCSKIGVGS